MQIVIRNIREQFKNGFKKLETNRAKVRINGKVGNYFVIGNENRYNVKLYRDDRGNRIAECQCKANENGMNCYHIAAAILVHTSILRARQ